MRSETIPFRSRVGGKSKRWGGLLLWAAAVAREREKKKRGRLKVSPKNRKKKGIGGRGEKRRGVWR